MQSIVSSNQKSITESKMVEAGKYVPLYASEPSFPRLGVQFQKITPFITTTVPHNNSITFKLPPGAGFLYDASLGFNCTYTIQANDNPDAPIGINMIRSIEWLSNGQPVSYKTGNAIWAMMKTDTRPSFQKFAFKYAKMLVPATEVVAAAAATSFLTYCPLPESFLMEVEKALLLNKITDLQLRVTFNSMAECGLIGSGDPLVGITGFIPTLYCQTYMPELSVYQEIVSSDWSKRLVMAAINTYTEVANLSSTTTASYTITCPFLVYKTHIFVRSVAPVAPGGGAVGAGNGTLQMSDITSLTMNLNGVTFLDDMPTSRLICNASKYGVSNDTVGAGDALAFGNDTITIDWGVLCKRTQNSGTAFFQELQGTNIKVIFTNVTDKDKYRLYLVHEYFNTLAWDNNVLSVDANN